MIQVDANGYEEAIKSDAPVLIKFFATWCGPCKSLATAMEQVIPNNPGIAFLELDIDKAPQIAQNVQVKGVPTMIMYKNNQEIARSVGFIPESDIQKFLDKNIHKG